MYPTHDLGRSMIHIVHFLFLGSFEAGAVMILQRWIGRAGKLGAATLLVQAL